MPLNSSLYDEAAHQRRLWTPNLLGADLLSWWDVGDLRDIASASSAVTTWRDRSGRGNSQTGTGTAVTLGDKKITSTSSGKFTQPTWDVHDGVWVGSPGSTATVRTIWSFGSPNFHQVNIAAGGGNFGIYNGGSNQQFGSLTWTASEPGIGYVAWAATTIAAARNGTAILTSITHTMNDTGGASFMNDNPAGTSGQPWGELNEYVYMTATRPLYIRETVTGYLAWKWDRLLGYDLVSKLPVTHTYKTKPPLIGS